MPRYNSIENHKNHFKVWNVAWDDLIAYTTLWPVIIIKFGYKQFYMLCWRGLEWIHLGYYLQERILNSDSFMLRAYWKVTGYPMKPFLLCVGYYSIISYIPGIRFRKVKQKEFKKTDLES